MRGGANGWVSYANGCELKRSYSSTVTRGLGTHNRLEVLFATRRIGRPAWMKGNSDRGRCPGRSEIALAKPYEKIGGTRDEPGKRFTQAYPCTNNVVGADPSKTGSTVKALPIRSFSAPSIIVEEGLTKYWNFFGSTPPTYFERGGNEGCRKRGTHSTNTTTGCSEIGSAHI